MGLEDVCQGILFFLVVGGSGCRGAVLCCAVVGSVSVEWIDGWMDGWDIYLGICMLLTAGYSISLFLPYYLVDYPL